MAGGSNQTATIFAAVQAAVEEVHRGTAEACAVNMRIRRCRREVEQVEARDGGLFRQRRRSKARLTRRFCRRPEQRFVEVETSSATADGD